MKNYYKNINLPKEKKLYSGFDAFSNNIIGRFKNIFSKKRLLKKEAKIIHKLSLEFSELEDKELDKQILEYQRKFRLNKVSNKELLSAFGLVVELGFRETQKRAYVVQIMGALALVKRYIIQMSTGEGKTLTASLSAVILGWMGKPVHILTSNDYLASRDCKLLKEFYSRANLSAGYVISTTSPEQKKDIYGYDL